MIPASDERVRTLVEQAKPRIVSASTVPAFSAGMAELNVFDVAGFGDVGQEATNAARGLGQDAVRAAKNGLAERYGARNPERGWIGFVLFAGALAAAVAAVLAFGLRTADPAQLAPAATILAVLAAACDVVALAGSRLRPMNRFVFRAQAIICIALVVAVAFSVARDLTVAAGVQAGAAAVTVAVAVVILVVRARSAEATADIDRSVEHAYLAAISTVEADARRVQSELDAALDPTDAALLVRVRTAVFAELADRIPALAAVDPLAPAGAAIIDSFADPDRWLPPALAKSRR